MKIAILHDYFDKRGGGERLVINLARKLNADIYTGFIDKNKTFNTKGMKIVSLGVKGKPQLVRNMRIAKRFESYNFPRYDAYIFSGTWCISAAEKLHPNLLYLHTPMRALYDLRQHFIWKSNPIERVFLRKFIRHWTPKDQGYMRKFDLICANSENVRRRVLKYYGKDVHRRTVVAYTGIETKKYKYKKSGDFYLSAARLDPLKRIDMIIRIFKKTGRKLVIAGSGPDEKRLKQMAAGCNNIKFLGAVSDNRLLELYGTCKATVAANVDEDLGLIAIESHASGKPILAIREGGFKETVNRSNGVFFSGEHDMPGAIAILEKTKWNHKKIKKSAERFDIEEFAAGIRKHLAEIIG
ncbi:MAG: mannosyltransferase [archaeon GW2011_AR5]|nr:MAG: mannosyltransferase [archaeon GW2011_AR5]